MKTKIETVLHTPMVHFRRTLIAAILATTGVGMAVAQNNTNSPYTRYGYGQLAEIGSANSRAMGGTAYALRDPLHVNSANPASYSAVDSLTFIFDGGISLQNTNFSNGTQKVNAKNSSFDYITMQFRAAPWAGISLGLLPYANVGYNISEYYADADTQEASSSLSYTGDGGLHQVYLGAGFKVFKGLSLGANMSFFWGSVTRTRTLSFPYDATKFATIINNEVNVKTWKLDIGAQYTLNLGKKNALTVGAVYSPGHEMSHSAYEYRQTGTDANASYSQQEIPGHYDLPSSWGVGLAYVYDQRLTLAADFMSQDWQDAAYEGSKNVFCRRTRFSFGAEMIPNPMGRNYLSRIKYRVGAFVSKPYYKIEGVRAADEYGVTAGFGLPVPRTRSMLSISGQYVRTQGVRANFLDENILRICVGITFNERWFFKRKVD